MATADEVIQNAYKTQPNLRLAKSKSETAIGAWDEAKNRFVMVAGKTIFEPPQWVSMPYELLINGNPPVSEWIEVTRG